MPRLNDGSTPVDSENSVHLTRGQRESKHDRRMIAVAFLFICVLLETLLRIRSLAGYIIGTLDSRFRKRQPIHNRRSRGWSHR
jgi:hypothetical protein